MLNPSFIGIDPGGNRLGVAVYTFDPVTLELTVAHVETLYVDRHAYLNDHLNEPFGERFTRIKVIEQHMSRLLDLYRPMWVAIETPYYGRLPAAFSALLECVGAVRQALIEHDVNVPLYNLSPMAVKSGVGSIGNDKDDVAAAILKLGLVDCVKDLDEHSTDALAVGYTMFSQLYLGATNEPIRRRQASRRKKSKKGTKKRRARKRRK